MENRAENGTHSSEEREIRLIGYLPDYLSELREMKAVFSAEDPEFCELQKAVREVRGAGFIEYCGERFLARFEDMLGIIPRRGEGLDERRQRVIIRWNESPPYTVGALEKKLALFCGEGNFSVSVDCERFLLNVEVGVFSNGVLLEIERLLARIVPANIVINSANKLSCEAGSRVSAGGAVSENFGFEIASGLDKSEALNGTVCLNAAAAVHGQIFIK